MMTEDQLEAFLRQLSRLPIDIIWRGFKGSGVLPDDLAEEVSARGSDWLVRTFHRLRAERRLTPEAVRAALEETAL
jgi:hypothetical protein